MKVKPERQNKLCIDPKKLNNFEIKSFFYVFEEYS